MRRLLRPSLGLIGQLVAILLLTGLLEFGTSVFLYERAGRFSVRDDEARRLAEHLVIARRLLAERPPAQRPDMARALTTDRYLVRWRESLPPPPRVAPALDAMRRQTIAWEPSLRDAEVSLWLADPGRSSVVAGELRLPDRSWMWFRTLEPVDGLNLAAERILLALIPAAGLLLLAGLAVRLVLRPLRALAAAAARAGPDAIETVPERGPREIKRVIRAFNGMQARIAQLVGDRTETLAAMGHDLRTPLARLRLRAERVEDPDTRRALEVDLSEMEFMVDSVLTYLRSDGDPEPPAGADVAVMCATLVDDAADRGLDARYEGPDHLELRVRPVALKRAVGNLLDNALHYAGRATVRVGNEPDGGVSITVEDDGPGIPPDQIDRATEPFVRLAPERPRDTEGFGLGLAIAARVAAREGGALRLVNRPEGGLAAAIALPRP